MVFSAELMDDIQREFPYARTDVWGNSRVFLDNGPGAMVLKRSADAQYHVSLELSACHGYAYPECRRVEEILDTGYKAVADLLNAPSPDTIVTGQTATFLMFQISYAVGRESDNRNNIVTTYYEHLSNITPWRELADRGHVGEVRLVRLREDGMLDMDHLREIVDDKTKVISISAASNLLGSKSPLAEIGEIARDAGALYVIDGVHHMAHGHMDVQAIGCDFLVMSGYKCFTPKYSAFLYGKRELLDSMAPYSSGKNHAKARGKWQLGSSDQAKLAAIAATVEYFERLGERVAGGSAPSGGALTGRPGVLKTALDAIEMYEKDISRAVLAGIDGLPGLPDIPKVQFYGLRDPNRIDERDPTFAFSIEGISGEDVQNRLVGDFNIAIRSMDYWSMAEDFFSLNRPTGEFRALQHSR